MVFIMKNQLSFFESSVWSVGDINRYIREVLEGEDGLQDIWVCGEISNLSKPSSGHVYFTLKDANSSLRCVMWKTVAVRQSFLPKDGTAVEVHGGIGVYEQGGQYQFYVDSLRPMGEGVLYQEYVRLKARLEAEGLFGEQYKLDIPAFPKIIGVITSPSGAALRDILNTIRRRYPIAEVILSPTPVQGLEAHKEIIKALQALQNIKGVDVALLARGGGSIEDLWAFNDEEVARAIFASKIPIITGIGHETDFTIADFVADLRCPTPTAAAEIATPNLEDWSGEQINLRNRLISIMNNLISSNQDIWNSYHHQLRRLSPLVKIRRLRQDVDNYETRISVYLKHYLQLEKLRFQGIKQELTRLNPSVIMQSGYAIVTNKQGKVIQSQSQVQIGEIIQVQVFDGKFNAGVME